MISATNDFKWTLQIRNNCPTPFKFHGTDSEWWDALSWTTLPECSDAKFNYGVGQNGEKQGSLQYLLQNPAKDRSKDDSLWRLQGNILIKFQYTSEKGAEAWITEQNSSDKLVFSVEQKTHTLVLVTISYAIRDACAVVNSIISENSRAFPIVNASALVIGTHDNDSVVLFDNDKPSSSDLSTKGFTGSYNPVALPLETDNELKVSVHVNAEFLQEIRFFPTKPFLRLGAFFNGSLIGQGKIDPERKDVVLTLCQVKEPCSIVGDVEWAVIDDNMAEIHKSQSRTFLEIYFIRPREHFFQRDSIPVQFLRLIVPPFGHAEPFKTYVTKRCFYDFGAVYNTSGGGSATFTNPKGENFRLTEWLAYAGQRHPVNCFDQAGILQLAFSLQLGEGEKCWIYQEPYGYIKKTKLVGIQEDCNNPFFDDRNAMRYPLERNIFDAAPATDPPTLKEEYAELKNLQENRCDPNPLVDEPVFDESRRYHRSKFRDHAYIRTPDGKVYDACAGPCFDLSVEEYIDKAIDEKRGLPEIVLDRKRMVNTELSDYLWQGVTIVDGNRGDEDATDSTVFKHRLGNIVLNIIDLAKTDLALMRHSNSDLNKLDKILEKAIDGKTALGPVYIIDDYAASVLWSVQNKNEIVHMRVMCHLDPSAAVETLARHLSSYSQWVEGFLEFPEPGKERGHYCLIDPRSTDGLALWVQGSLYISIRCQRRTSDSTQVSAQKLMHLVDEAICANNVENERDWLHPEIKNDFTELTGGAIRLKSNITLVLDVKDALKSFDVTSSQRKLVPIDVDQKKFKVTFTAKDIGEDEITFAFAHKENLSVVSKKLKVKVVE